MISQKQVGFIKDAIFLSHTSLNDFVTCPRAYYLKNIYRNPETGFRMQITSPYLALGATVHDTLEWYLKNLGAPLFDLNEQFRNFWWKYHGLRGGFTSAEEEAVFGKRGLKMLENFSNNASCLGESLPKPTFPKYPLFEKVILLGNMDFVGQLPDGSLHVLDFKTGSKDEDSPIQLYIYAILAENYYGKPVSKASFWYLDRDEKPKEVVLDPLEQTIDWLTKKGQEIKQALEKNDWQCIKGERMCRDCRDYTAILEGKGKLVFTDYPYKKEVFYLPRDND